MYLIHEFDKKFVKWIDNMKTFERIDWFTDIQALNLDYMLYILYFIKVIKFYQRFFF